MSVVSWLGWLLLSGVAAAASVWHYRTRETPGRGRTLLAGLRALAFAVVFLLLFDPELPAGGRVTSRGSQVLLDASLSMNLPGRWDAAVARARSTASDRPVVLFGSHVRAVPASALPDSAPGDVRSLLLPALQAAAEAGVRRVRVLTDGGVQDAEAVARWAPRLGLEIETETFGGDVANASVVEVSGPGWVPAGEPAVLEFGVVAPPGDSVRVVARREGRILGRTLVEPPGAGRVATGRMEVRLETPPGGGLVRLEVALERGDRIPDDDVRTLYVQVGEEPAGVVLLSLRPDWEPRFLAPVLEQSLGLPLRGFLRGATGQYVRMGSGLDAGSVASEADVRRALERAELLVLHGVSDDAPAWARAGAAAARRLLVFPADGVGGLNLPLTPGPPAPGDFFPSASIPPSPVAPLLAELPTAGATPLAELRMVTDTQAGAWAPLLATRGRQGAPLPVLLAGESGGRRWAIALGSGYWQWAFRGGTERQLYTRLWSALAGWLAQERGVAATPTVRPARMTAPRGEPLAWVTGGAAADSIHLVLATDAGQAVLDTTIVRAAGDTAWSAPVQPGHYRYRARAFAGTNVLEGAGVLTVERYSPELARPRAELGDLSAATVVRGGQERRTGRPLHATAYPWLLLVALLAAEWILRRRWGLR